MEVHQSGNNQSRMDMSKRGRVFSRQAVCFCVEAQSETQETISAIRRSIAVAEAGPLRGRLLLGVSHFHPWRIQRRTTRGRAKRQLDADEARDGAL